MTAVDRIYEKEKEEAVAAVLRENQILLKEKESVLKEKESVLKEKESVLKEKENIISTYQKTIISILDNKFDTVPISLIKKIRLINDVENLSLISTKIFKTSDLAIIEDYCNKLVN